MDGAADSSSSRVGTPFDSRTTTDVARLLDEQLVGTAPLRCAAFGGEPSVGLRDGVDAFAWASVARAPKADHGELTMPAGREWYRALSYYVLHNNSFLRLFTVRGRAYWCAQNEQGHRTPDWKLHASVALDDVPRAWNVLAALFIEARAEIGMKATLLDAHDWPERQRGRELTVYVYTFDPSFVGYMQDHNDTAWQNTEGHKLYLGPEHEACYTPVWWFRFVTEAERRLAAAGVRSRGCADGDLPLPGCRYLSLRNEAYVRVRARERLVIEVARVSTRTKKRRSLDDDDNNNNNDDEDDNHDNTAAVAAVAAADDAANNDSRRSHSSTSSEEMVESLRRVALDDNDDASRAADGSAFELAYPPNDRGWNAAGHVNPMLTLLFFLQQRALSIDEVRREQRPPAAVATAAANAVATPAVDERSSPSSSS